MKISQATPILWLLDKDADDQKLLLTNPDIIFLLPILVILLLLNMIFFYSNTYILYQLSYHN